MSMAAYELKLPDVRTTSVIFASPHSGRDYNRSFLERSVLNELTIRSSEDAFVDILFDSAPACGAPLLAAQAPRAFVDLNRSSEELDPALIDGITRGGHNPRVTSGLGVIPRVVANGQTIYRGKLSQHESNQRLHQVWIPYHAELLRLINQSHAIFGEAVLIDCHSMPHEAIETITQNGHNRPDIVLGDRFGAAAGSEVVERIESAFANAGLSVARNAPFAGAYTTQHYGRPSREQHVVQIEIDRSLYMDEHKVEPNGDFEAFRTVIAQVVAEVAAIGAVPASLAAE